ncbi:IgGFc-binding protein [Polyangium sp. y55x31]|uniref:IgGFc-binding protein n=1 Tax=Polyangium sp. y55x31 TaxID=3042688 RepID=UPI0024825C13|nr:IgGFc-binding protein [Polyangium sp. y55x31]MDI1476126.1 IgGFc-binding protein [Polyangium sp. y55x31]
MNERSRRSRKLGTGALVLGTTVLVASCFDKSTRWEEVEPKPPPPPVCEVGLERCTTALERCTDTGAGVAWTVVEDCAAEGLVCAPLLFRCTTCIPNAGSCKGQEAYRCNADGTAATLVDTCDPSKGIACRAGSCVDLCGRATVEKSNVGCEYWAVDLDNAMIDATSNAAAQQFAVVVSNPHPDIAVSVHIAQDDGLPGSAAAPYDIATAVIAPLNLQVFKLGPREVDGSPEGEYDTGTHTALTRHAYRVRSDFPVVAYQFNPLENVNVFSNDASLLKPTEALSFGVENTVITSYVVVGWPQTIAATDDPDTNFNPNDPTNLRSFLTVVGTQPNTTVRVKTTAKVVGGGPVPETPENGIIEVQLDAFDVLNLETGDFNADFTGSTIESNGPIAVFTGGEASDAPHFPTLAYRRCCADHLEDQLDPIRTAGKSFAVPHTPSRTRMVKQAGGLIEEVPEPDYVRFVAASKAGAKITTSLPPPYDVIELKWLGDSAEVTTYRNFTAESTEPIIVAQIMGSQDAAGVRRGLPGGDPSLLIVPPLEQARPDYVFLTPDKYVFDYISIVVPADQGVLLDEILLGPDACEITPADGLTVEERGGSPPELLVYNCQLSFPLIQGLANFVITLPGKQNDGVHRVVAGVPVIVTVGGFDSYVSYSYAAGTELRAIALPQ